MHPPAEPGTSGERPARLRVGIVGTGRVGAVLGAALDRVGHRVVAVSAVSEASRERARALLPEALVVDALDVLPLVDLAVLAVPDDTLPELAAGLAATGATRPGQLILHPSGRWGIDVLAPLTREGALPLAVHPAMTFTGTSVDLARLAGCSFAVTTFEPLRPIGHALVVEMGGEPQDVEEDARLLYHAALASAANSTVTLVAQSLQLLERCGVAEPARLLGPLMYAALDGALRRGDDALTGPVARGDAGTVAGHVRALAQVSPAAAAGYVALARLTADRALAAGLLSPQAAEALLDVLAESS